MNTGVLPTLARLEQGSAGRGGPRSGTSATRSPCPPALTGGESSTDQKSKLDWFTVTWKPEPDEVVGMTIHSLLSTCLGGVMGEECAGMLGYGSGVRFYIPYMGNLISVARVDYGGDNKGGRARLDISGAGCGQIQAWELLAGWIQNQQDAKITRVDLAVDCLEGEFTVDDCKDWWLAGDFATGGRNPRHSTLGDWFSSPSVYGRTFTVGRRENGKMLRCYEKGKQLGDQSSPWVRWEVEIRNNDRDIPFDILTSPDKYFTGSYKCLASLLPVAAERIKTHQKEGQISMEQAIEYAKTGYGQLVYCMKEFMTEDEIYQSLHRQGVPKRLERAALGGFFNGSLTDPFLKD